MATSCSVRRSSIKVFTREGQSFLTSPVLSQLAGEHTRLSEELEPDGLLGEEGEGEAPRLVLGERMACSTCRVEFTDRQQQVQHFKLDWHRYNIKRRIASAAAVTEEDFEEMSDVSSISGSDTEARDTSEPEIGNQINDMHLSSRLPKFYFTGPDNLLYSLYKCVVPSEKTEDTLSVSRLSRVVENPVWAIIMLSGGHFAGAVFRGNDIVAHKTFHRYTVRAKSGMAQSVRDSQGNQPKSAGASLRRYNEAALQQDICTLIESWATHLDQASAIFLRVPGENKKLFFSGKTPLLSKDDSRVSSIPFATRRPTLKEVERVHDILSTIQCHGTREEFLRAQEEQSLIRAVKRKRFANKKSLTEKTSLKSEKGPEDVGAAIVYRRDLVVPSRKLDSDTEDPGNVVGNVLDYEMDSTIRMERTQKKRTKKGKASVNQQEGEEQQLERKPSAMKEEQEKELSLDDKMIAACKAGALKAVRQLLDALLHQCGLETEREVREHEDEDVAINRIKDMTVEQTSDAKMNDADTAVVEQECEIAVERDVDAFIPCDEEKALNLIVNKDEETVLHAAAQGGHPAIITFLLSRGANPALKDKRGRPPYVVAQDKLTRNAFRRFMSDHPGRYDYSAAQVPSALTDELEKEQERKKLEKKKAQRKAKKQKDKEEKEATRKKQAAEEERQKWDALSEREKRAIAAEKRLAQQLEVKAARGKSSGECSWCCYGLDGVTPFHKFDYKYCSLQCLKSHREELQSQ